MKIFWKLMQWLVLTGFMVVFVFVINSYRYMIYAIIVASVLYFFLRKIIVNRLNNRYGSTTVRYEVNGKSMTKQMGKLSSFAVLLAVVYFVFVSVFSLSPGLKRKEFRMTHPNWVAVTPTILDLSCNIQGGRMKYAYVDLEYQFAAHGQSYSQKIRKAEKRYSFLPIGRKGLEKMRTELLNRVNQKKAAKEYVVFYHPQDPGKQKFFLSNDSFYLKGAWLYDLLFVYCILLSGIAVIIFSFSKGNNRMNIS